MSPKLEALVSFIIGFCIGLVLTYWALFAFGYIQ